MSEKIYDIAVVGEYMAGKSTWISALCREDVAEMLEKIHREKECGRTKVPAHYLLKDTGTKFCIESVEWNYGKLIDCLQAGQKEQMEKIFASLGLPVEEALRAGYQGKDMKAELKKYLQSDRILESIRKSQDLPEFLKNVVNNEIFAQAGIISYIEFSVAVAPEVWKEISDRGLDYVRIRDTSSLLEESAEKMQQLLEKAEEILEKRDAEDRIVWYEEMDPQKVRIREMLRERGILGTDAIIFMGISGSKVFDIESMRKTYESMIAYLLENHSVFLMVRTDKMTEHMRQKDETYRESCDRILKDEDFSGLDELRGLLEDCRKLFHEEKGYKRNIAQKHYHELFLANLSITRMQKDENWNKEIYRPCVLAAFGEVMEGVGRYRESMETAKRCLEEIASHTVKLKELYEETFLDNIAQKSPKSAKECYYSGLFDVQTAEWMYKRLKPYCDKMAGAQEGIIKNRKCTTAVLNAVYRLEEKLFQKLVDKLEPEIDVYVSQKEEEDRVSEAARKMRDDLQEYFTHYQKMDHESMGEAADIVPAKYLEDACRQTKAYFTDEGFNFKESFPELEGRYSDEAWERDKEKLAVVKYGVWKLMISHLGWKDTENDK